MKISRHLIRLKNSFIEGKRSYSSLPLQAGKRSLEWVEPNGFDTGITLYNSACKKKVKLKTKLKGIVSWYACGPTVYDSAHIGHACCYINQDIIRRIMQDVCNLNVMFVMGITDIDDKIITAANSSGKEVENISKHHEKEFFSDLTRLNVKMPTISARVTDYVPDIIAFVEQIYKKGYAYSTSDGSVYFRVNKYGKYGKLHPAEEETQKTDELGKESTKDFALWKGAKAGEPAWSSPWGLGRPGWHIECSAIASRLLGNEIDIHSGGIDLLFPHHENEEAQSCCYHGNRQWVNYWLHTGHLRLAGDVKLSKSLKNTISISEFLSKYSSCELRMFCLLTRYRSGIEFSEENMQNAVSVCRKLDNFLSDCIACIKDSTQFGLIDETLLIKCLNETQILVADALSNDFDTPRAISHVIHLVSMANKMLHQPIAQTSIGHSVVGLAAVYNYIHSLLRTLGYISEKQDSSTSQVDHLLESAVSFRTQIRKAVLKISRNHPPESIELKKELLNYCDDFRRELHSNGIELKDLGDKTSWNIVQKS